MLVKFCPHAKIGKIIVFLTCLLIHLQAAAQFYTDGSDPAGIRWYQITTAGYRVIYPEGTDSLARVYARNLENVRQAVGSGLGIIPNGNYRHPMPVILHTKSAISNGMVTWAPRRMELYTTPDAFSPESTCWEKQLAIHESRHVAQMQIGMSHTFKWLKYPFGELVDGALSAVYGGPAFFEGDAVVAETSLTNGGRGRAADFLEYQRVCFDAGEFRNYWQWLYGSLDRFTPDHYTIGYMLNAGTRSLYGEPDFTKRFYDRIYSHHGITFRNTQKTVQEISGKSFKESFREISSHFQDNWKILADSRAPFMKSDSVLVHERRYFGYSGLGTDGHLLWAVRSGLSSPAQLVSISRDGEERFCRNFASRTSDLKYTADGSRVYWSEIRPDLRWEQASSSDICYREADGKVVFLTKGERYFNPAPSPDGRLIAVTEYPSEGGSRMVLLDENGSRVSVYDAPSGMQILEPVWVDGNLYLSAISEVGIGIYSAEGFGIVLAAQSCKISNLKARDGQVLFVSDRSGVMELYSLDPRTGCVRQLSCIRHGAHDFVFLGDSLYYTMHTPRSENIYRTALADLPVKEVDFFQHYEDPVASCLSAGEKIRIEDEDVEMSPASRYSKLGHLFRFHSWSPLYVNYDSVTSISSDNISQNFGLGATAFFQNDLGNSYGSIGYHLDHRGWRSSGFVKYSYTGWYPVVEAELDINTRNALYYRKTADQGGLVMKTQSAGKPLIRGWLKTYVPLNFSSGGWRRGVIPQISYSATNDLYGYYTTQKSFLVNSNMSRLTVNVRAYTMLRTPESCIFPRWGMGLDAGWSMTPFMTDVLASNIYAYLYAYVPGFFPMHGVKLSGTFVGSPAGAIFAQETVNTAPRGFTNAANIPGTYPSRNKLSVDYVMPFASLDWDGLCPVAYVRNLELAAHGDYCFYHTSRTSGSLFSVGGEFRVKLGNLLWIPYATRVGISFDYNGGSSFNEVSARTGDGHTSVGLVFSMEL